MYLVNKIVGVLIDPLWVGWGLLVLCAACFAWRPGRRWARWGLVAGLAWLWAWSTPLMSRLIGWPLEREWLVDGRVPRVEGFPVCEAIVVLGGGMGGDARVSDYAEMWTGADRVWQAARLWKAGKAPKVIVTGGRVAFTTRGLLRDFGIPEAAIDIAKAPRNTEEEAKEVARRLGVGTDGRPGARPRVLVVTSAWHAKRAKLMFEKYAPDVEAVLAPADFELSVSLAGGFSLGELLPTGEATTWNRICLHEWIGYFGYRIMR